MQAQVRILVISWVTYCLFFVFPVTASAEGCGVNVSTEGSFFSGRTFRSSKVLPNSKKSTSFDKIFM